MYMVVPKEVLALAKHHLEILERKFPQYKYAFVEGGWPDCWICVRERGCLIYEITFMSSSIQIRPSWMHVNHSTDIVVDYADPRFTDDTIFDVIEKTRQTGHFRKYT